MATPPTFPIYFKLFPEFSFTISFNLDINFNFNKKKQIHLKISGDTNSKKFKAIQKYLNEGIKHGNAREKMAIHDAIIRQIA